MANTNQNLEALLSQSNPPLRQRRQRTSFTDDVIQALEEKFKTNPYPDINERETMAREFKTTEDRIQVWFQNKRARFRKRMHKENDKSQTKSKSTKSKPSKYIKSDYLDQSPIRVTESTSDEQFKTKQNSTPVSVFASINRANFSFNNSPQLSFNDSGYSSNSVSEISDYQKYYSMSYNSPPAYSVSQFPSFLFSPINLINYQNNQISNHDSLKSQINQRTAKSVFRPFE